MTVRSILIAIAFVLLGGYSVASAAEDYLRRSDTVVTFSVPLDHPSDPGQFLGDGAWTMHQEGQGPSISVNMWAQFEFATLATIQEIRIQASADQFAQSETNHGTSAYLRIEHLNLSHLWETVYFNKPYENNFDGGQHTTGFAWDLDLVGIPELATGSYGIRFTLDSRGYANSSPGEPFVSVVGSLIDASVTAVPEPSGFILAGIALMGLATRAWPKRA
jgi:hypothetical protein